MVYAISLDDLGRGHVGDVGGWLSGHSGGDEGIVLGGQSLVIGDGGDCTKMAMVAATGGGGDGLSVGVDFTLESVNGVGVGFALDACQDSMWKRKNCRGRHGSEILTKNDKQSSTIEGRPVRVVENVY